VLVKHFDVSLVEQVYQIHLPHHHHASLILVQSVDERLIIFVVDVESLIAGNDTRFGQLADRKFEEWFAYGHIDMYRSFSVVI